MIPIYRNTLTRIDLSSVLHYMVENMIDGTELGKKGAHEIAKLLGCRDGVALRSPVDAVLHVAEWVRVRHARKNGQDSSADSLGQQSIILPVTAPWLFASRLCALGLRIFYYDVDMDGISPILHGHEDFPVDDTTLWVRIHHFGGTPDIHYKKEEESKIHDTGTSHGDDGGTHAKRAAQAFFFDIPCVDICWSFPLPDKEIAAPAPSPNTVFTVLMIEHNTLVTGAAGAILCVQGKEYAKMLNQSLSSMYQLSDMNAALVLAQLKQLDSFVARVKNTMPLYLEACSRTRHRALSSITAPSVMPQCFPVLIHSRIKEVIAFSHKQKVDCIMPFQSSVLAHILEVPETDKDKWIEHYSLAVKLLGSTVCFPLYPSLDNEEISKIIKIVSSLP